MGDIKKKQKLFTRPKQKYDRKRIDEENILVKKYGLKNKREIWKAKSQVTLFRKRAKSLIGAEAEKQQKFFEKLNKMGMGVTNTADVLALTEENLLNRRLQTIVYKKGLANSPNQARQLIVHKHVLVDGGVVNTPSFLVTLDLEDKISLKERKVKEKVSEEKLEIEEKEELEENKEGEK